MSSVDVRDPARNVLFGLLDFPTNFIDPRALLCRLRRLGIDRLPRGVTRSSFNAG